MIRVTAEKQGEEKLAEVNEDLVKFDEWFQKLGNEPLAESEKSMIRTYLAYKTKESSGG